MSLQTTPVARWTEAEVPDQDGRIGPDGWHEERGFPRLVEPSALARDESAQRQLWQESERLTEVSYAI